MVGQTFVQKVLASHAGLDGQSLAVNQIVTVKPDHLLTHDNTDAIVGKISKELAEFGICDTEFPVIVLDHVVPACGEKNAAGHKRIREFVHKYNVKNFFDCGAGVCHQVLLEKGLAAPGSLIVGSDSHTCTYGAVGSFSTGVDRTEAASLLLQGELWMKVPPTIKVTLNGKLSPGVTAKDFILLMVGTISSSGAAYSTLEFHGEGINELSIDDRMTISNMGVEMDSKGAVFPMDEITEAYLRSHGVSDDAIAKGRFYADRDAEYEKELTFDLSEVVPMISKPHKVDNICTVKDIDGMKVNQLFLGTCTNGRYSDLRAAADLMQGRKVHSDVRMLVCPASQAEFKKALADDTISILVDAGAMILPTGCGPCLGAHQGVLAPEEICLSTANRNFKGRMGCKEAFIYLSSPLTVAATAIRGRVTDPRELIV